MNAKEKIMAIAKNVPVPTDYWGVLNEHNIYSIAARVRLYFYDKFFAIAVTNHIDSDAPQLSLHTNLKFNSSWTDGNKEQVRVFDKGDDHIFVGCSSPWMSWSANGYLWSFHPAPGNSSNHNNYLFPYFKFNQDRMTIVYRAPAGKGCLHMYAYVVQETAGQQL